MNMLSSFVFHKSQDPYFDNEFSDFIRVTKDGVKYGYINRRNGNMITPYIFESINLVGFNGFFAIESLDNGSMCIVFTNGTLVRLPGLFE